MEELAAGGVKLLVTVDCGINARAEVARAGELGMDVIVTDHHEMEGPPPDCVVVTPKLPGYPCPQLAGVGVAFKLAHALLEEPTEARVEVPLALRPLSDVVAIGTIADIVPLVDENRVLASIGLGRLRSSPRPGLAALMEVAGVKADGVNAGTVGFRLAPRLNAAGRLEDASLALELLGCADRETALPMALRLNELNQERQAIEAGILAAAVEMVSDPPPPALVLSSPAWHEGVVGIVASRVVERFNRPAILLSEGDEEAKGSGRSIPGFDLLGAVERSAEHLLAFGGHRAACGLRLRREHIPAFRAAFVAQAAAMLSEADLVRTQPVDAVVGGHDLTLGLADELELLAPHGFGNRKVTLLLHGAELVGPRLTRDHRHAQYRVRCDGATCQAIHFNFDKLLELKEPGRFDVPLSLVEERVQRRRERPGRGQGAASARRAGARPVRHRLRSLVPGPTDRRCPVGRAARRSVVGGGGWTGRARRGARGRPPSRPPRLRRRLGARLVGGGRRARARAGRRRRSPPPAAQPRRALAAARTPRRVPAGGLRGPAGRSAGRPRPRDDRLRRGGRAPAAGRGLRPRRAPRPAADAAPLCGARRRGARGVGARALGPRRSRRCAAQVAAAELDLDATMRRAWRALSAGSGRFDEALEQELLGGDPFLRSAGAAAAALRALRDAGLLRLDESGGYHLERPQSKVDVTQTDTYRAWHTQFQTSDFLRTCLTAGI